eukprot:CFRG5408T1
MGDLIRNIHPEVAKYRDELIEIRRHFHKHPELGYKEFETAAYVAKYLRDLGIEVTSGVGVTGVVGLLKGATGDLELPCVALRADMDGLPLLEATGLDFSSVNEGVMHACGHDAHMAMLLVAAKVLSKMRSQIKGCVKFLFQPAEEGGGGAVKMIEDGCLNSPNVDEVYGLHVWNYLPTGSVDVVSGPVMAAVDSFIISVTGLGGHGAVPENTVDAVLVSGHLITALHSIVSRNVSPLDSAVLTIGTVNGGFANNVIADHCELRGTARVLNPDMKSLVKKRMEEVCSGIGHTFNAKVELNFHSSYPVTDNKHLEPYDNVRKAAEQVVGKAGVTAAGKTMASEDFSFFMLERPGCFFFIPSKIADEIERPHHKTIFTVNEDCLEIGSSVFVNLVQNILT